MDPERTIEITFFCGRDQSFEKIFPYFLPGKTEEEKTWEAQGNNRVVYYVPHTVVSAFSVREFSAFSSSALFFSISSLVILL
jgi:hypothetical protein